MSPGAQSEALRGGQLLEAVSNLVVATFVERVGRGPTRVRTQVAANLVVCLLEDTMTRSERTLVEAGRGAKVLEVREELQAAMEREMVAGVEALSGGRVRGLIGGASLAADLAVEVFVLEEPSGERGVE
jgi:uncharacterized protein YbcI